MIEDKQLEKIYKRARQIFKGLDVPVYMPNNPEVKLFNIIERPFENQGWNVYISPRNMGKTTSMLLYCLCLGQASYELINQRITFAYIRTVANMITEKNMTTLFGVINDYKDKNGKGYIEKITDGKYNKVIYKRSIKKFFYCNSTNTGEVEDLLEIPIGHCFSVEECDNYKSSFADELCYALVYDEFIDQFYRNWVYSNLMNLVSTIKRSRKALIFMSANCLDRDYQIFYDFDLVDVIRFMELGDKEVMVTPLGTRVWIEVVAPSGTKNKPVITDDIRRYFGFSSKKLEGITGLQWSYTEYPHAPKQGVDFVRFDDDVRIYIQYYQNPMQIELVTYKEVLYLYVHRFTGDYKGDYIVYTNDPMKIDPHFVYGFGHGTKLDKLIWRLAEHNRIFFGDNRTGSLFHKYLVETNKNVFKTI